MLEFLDRENKEWIGDDRPSFLQESETETETLKGKLADFVWSTAETDLSLHNLQWEDRLQTIAAGLKQFLLQKDPKEWDKIPLQWQEEEEKSHSQEKTPLPKPLLAAETEEKKVTPAKKGYKVSKLSWKLNPENPNIQIACKNVISAKEEESKTIQTILDSAMDERIIDKDIFCNLIRSCQDISSNWLLGVFFPLVFETVIRCQLTEIQTVEGLKKIKTELKTIGISETVLNLINKRGFRYYTLLRAEEEGRPEWLFPKTTNKRKVSIYADTNSVKGKKQVTTKKKQSAKRSKTDK